MTPDATRTTTERAIIGCMLLEPSAIDAAIRAGMTPTWFSDPTANGVVAQIFDRHARNKVVDGMTITAARTWLDDCVDMVATTAHTGFYLTVLAGYVAKQDVQALAGAIKAIADKTAPEDAAELKASVERMVYQVMTRQTADDSNLSLAAHAWIDRMTAPDEKTVLLDWPVQSITYLIGRVDRELIWLVAQPSCGKTAFCLQWCMTLALHGITTSMASLESPIESIASRLIAQAVPMDTYPLRQRKASPETIEAARQGADRLSAHMRITDGSMSMDQLYAWGRSEKRRGSKMLIVDNTRHVRMDGYKNRVDKMADMSVRLKQLRDDVGLPVVVCHHSNKDDDVSWSSDVERDTDLLCFLREDSNRTRPGRTYGDPGEWCISFDVEKNREGRKNVREFLRFVKEHQRFEPWEQARLAIKQGAVG